MKGTRNGVDFGRVMQIRNPVDFLSGYAKLSGEIDGAGIGLDHGIEKKNLGDDGRREFNDQILFGSGGRLGNARRSSM